MIENVYLCSEDWVFIRTKLQLIPVREFHAYSLVINSAETVLWSGPLVLVWVSLTVDSQNMFPWAEFVTKCFSFSYTRQRKDQLLIRNVRPFSASEPALTSEPPFWRKLQWSHAPLNVSFRWRWKNKLLRHQGLAHKHLQHVVKARFFFSSSPNQTFTQNFTWFVQQMFHLEDMRKNMIQWKEKWTCWMGFKLKELDSAVTVRTWGDQGLTGSRSYFLHSNMMDH